MLACADGDDRGLHVINFVNDLTIGRLTDQTLHVDSKGLLSTITTLHNRRYYRLRQMLQCNIDLFEARESDIMQWVQSEPKVANLGIKWSPEINKTFTNIIYT